MTMRILDTLIISEMRNGVTEGGKPRPRSPFIDSCQASQLKSFTRTRVDFALAVFSITQTSFIILSLNEIPIQGISFEIN